MFSLLPWDFPAQPFRNSGFFSKVAPQTHSTHTIDGEEYFAFTFPVRDGAIFAATGPFSAAIDGIVYTVEATSDFGSGALDLIEINPPLIADMPLLSAGWSYHTIRLTDSLSAEPKGFVGLRIQPVP